MTNIDDVRDKLNSTIDEQADTIARQELELAEARQELELALSTITLSEILAGPYKNGHTALAKRYEKALASYRVVELSTPIAVLAAQLRARFTLKLPDAIQVATALEIGADALVTHDRDFSKVRGISVVIGD